MTWLLATAFGRKLVAIGAAIVVAGVIALTFAAKLFNSGKASAQAAQREAELSAVREAHQIEADTSAKTPAAQRAELQDWARRQ